MDRPEDTAAFVMNLRSRGVRDLGVLGAMERVPRSFFAPRRFHDLARSDIALPLDYGQTMTAPSVVAAMLVALGVETGDAVLEIGTGSGYVSGLMAQLGAEVVTVERHAPLAESAAARLTALGYGRRIRCEIGDGLVPAAGERFARILVNGALAALPPALAEGLAPGGRLVGALASDGFPRLVTAERRPDGALDTRLGGPLRIGPIATSPLSRGERAGGEGAPRREAFSRTPRPTLALMLRSPRQRASRSTLQGSPTAMGGALHRPRRPLDPSFETRSTSAPQDEGSGWDGCSGEGRGRALACGKTGLSLAFSPFPQRLFNLNGR